MNNIFLPLAALIVVALLVYVIVNAKKKDNHFDEMQLIKRAKGYKIGYFILLIGLTVYAGLSAYSPDLKNRVEPSIAVFIIMMISILIFAVYCIFNEAFFTIGENAKGYSFVCIAMILLNGIGCYRTISEGEFLKDGIITYSGTGNLIVTGVFAVILVCIIVKSIMNKREAEE